MKKALMYVGVILIGSIATATIDTLINVNFSNVGYVAEIVHKVAYMVWGAIFIDVTRRL